jgi:hypothetical protein
MNRLFLISLLLTATLHASFSEDKLKVVLIGKVSKYVVWPKKEQETKFNITILNNPFGSLPEKIYKNKTIDSREVSLHYIDTIDELQKSDVLYIPESQTAQLQEILQHLKGKGIFTISDIKGFAQKGGMLQLYFVSRKIKLKINLQSVKEEHLNIRSTLLRIAKVIKEAQ